MAIKKGLHFIRWMPNQFSLQVMQKQLLSSLRFYVHIVWACNCISYNGLKYLFCCCFLNLESLKLRLYPAITFLIMLNIMFLFLLFHFVLLLVLCKNKIILLILDTWFSFFTFGELFVSPQSLWVLCQKRKKNTM